MESFRESSVVLARKYRPIKLSGLVGQDMLVLALCNAISNNRIPHALLFSGIRGIGKTSIARAFAMSLNCIGADGSVRSPVTDACGLCSNCVSIIASSHCDVIEFDAASHTGVADMRSIIESVGYSSSSARWKIYIIDEVHMLSSSAFNAMLKTLEEPPDKVVFIFATTEPEKIPVTVLSRCQRFSLERIGLESMVDHIITILDKEGIKYEKSALSIIASASEGSVRDALSLLDMAILKSGGGDIVADIVSNMIGISNREPARILFSQILSGNATGVIKVFDDMYNSISSIESLMSRIMEVCYHATLIKIGNKDIVYRSCQTDYVEKIESIIESTKLSVILRLWQVMVNRGKVLTGGFVSKIEIEMFFVELCHCSLWPSIDDILNIVDNKSYNMSHNVCDTKHGNVNINGSSDSIKQETSEVSNVCVNSSCIIKNNAINSNSIGVSSNIPITNRSIDILNDVNNYFPNSVIVE